ncbi:hypothetical protein [Kribbella sp.]|uniref:hypothetical protein n=1 Tax=Kribbella sp. TaxID=1871183 RepID=UPI002D33EC7F|nr:hypothetical protein [Kribbella sp.]HZX02379.1 hypothetical protein [Kribbella sp.]
MSLTRTSAVAASAALLGALTVAAPSATAATTAACTMSVGSITAGGDIGYSNITAGSPVTAKQGTGVHMFTPGITKLSTTWVQGPKTASGQLTSGEVMLNTSLYQAWYGTDKNGKAVTGFSNSGKNYQGYTYEETSSYRADGLIADTYRLRGDGALYRFEWHWTDFPYTTNTRFNGFSAVKTMTLISETPTYDTFLANTRGGALYTIHIPRAAGKQPIVKKIRTSTWQTFESLVAERCGTQSTLLTAIDKNTGTAYLYAVSHGATVIKSLGKIPGTYKDPVYYLHTTHQVPPLYGE